MLVRTSWRVNFNPDDVWPVCQYAGLRTNPNTIPSPEALSGACISWEGPVLVFLPSSMSPYPFSVSACSCLSNKEMNDSFLRREEVWKNKRRRCEPQKQCHRAERLLQTLPCEMTQGCAGISTWTAPGQGLLLVQF